MIPARWLALVLVVAALAACGDADDGDDGGDGGPAAGTPSTELEVTAGVVDDPASRGVARLTCGPDGATGTAWLEGEAAARACELLADEAVRAQLEPPPIDQMCAEVYGGPDVATVVGTVDGEPVDATLDRRNGCAISRWDALVPLLPAPVGDAEDHN